MNNELPDVQAGLRKGRGTIDQIANIHWIIKKEREFQKDIYFCFVVDKEMATHSSTLAWKTPRTEESYSLQSMGSQRVWHDWLRHFFQFSSVQFSCSVVSNSLQPHELQHARPTCPSPTPGAYSNPCPLSWWCHPAISSCVIPFSCPQSLPASGSFPVGQLLTSLWGMKTDLFQSCDHCCVFQICWHIECHTFTASSFRIWNSSTGIPSPPLALFVVMLSKANLTSHSGMSGSRWMITPSWLSGSWRSFLYSLCIFATPS